MEDLKWMTPKGMKSGNDVTINVGTTSQGDCLYFTFRNGLYTLISETGYIRFAISNNRIYFGESKENRGYKMVKQNTVKADNRYVSLFEPEYVNAMRIYKGDYDLKYDKERKLHYIEKE